MKRWGLFGAALLGLTGCDSGGPVDTGTPLHQDGGPPPGYVVILDGGGDAATPPDGPAPCPAGGGDYPTRAAGQAPAPAGAAGCRGGVCNYQAGGGCQAPTRACIRAWGPGGVVTPACGGAAAGVSGTRCKHAPDCARGSLCSSDGPCHKLCCGGDWTGC